VINRMGQILQRAALTVAACCTLAAGGPVPIDAVEDVYPTPIDWEGKRVLHIGDSHVSSGLVTGLRQRLRTAGAVYVPVTWVGSRSKSWVASGKLKRLLREHGPAAVIVTLGTNAIRAPRPERQAPWVRALVKLIGPRKCYWLGPPSLIDDHYGYNAMFERECRPCRYFETRLLGFPARRDGKFHLTRAQGRTWADQTWAWINGDWPRPGSHAL
jgi:hypothetical protein